MTLGHLFPDVGGLVLGACIRVRGVDEVQEVDECPEVRSEPDSESALYPLVVSYDQSS